MHSNLEKQYIKDYNTVTKSTHKREDKYGERYTVVCCFLAWEPSQVACFSEDLQCWEAWDTTCGRKAQGHHTINRLGRGGVERGSARRPSSPWMAERGPSSIRQNTGNVSKATSGTLLRDRVEHVWAFPSARIPPWTDQTELNRRWNGKKKKKKKRISWQKLRARGFSYIHYDKFHLLQACRHRPKHSPQTANLKVRHLANYASIMNLRSPATQKHKQGCCHEMHCWVYSSPSFVREYRYHSTYIRYCFSWAAKCLRLTKSRHQMVQVCGLHHC